MNEPAAEDMPDPGPQLLECDEPPLATHALVFAPGDRVSMQVAPSLGLERFTLEAWVRRDARGALAGTGVGGLELVPIIAKGRGESDGSNVDCNYAFGFVGDVLGADFEDMATGANHPVVGKTPLRYGRWYHVAATYDGTTWRLYVDGALDAQVTVGETPRADSIQHFGLGAAFNSRGEPAGGFVGALDEVRVYARALDASEIAATMHASTPSSDGLVSHFRLEPGENGVEDAAGENPGTATGTTLESPGPVLDRGAPPSVGNVRAARKGDTMALMVDAADPEGGPVEIEFRARELTEKDDFTVVVLPDSQYYTRNAAPPGRPQADNPEFFYAQTRWAMENRVARNVVGLFHVGDIINNADVPAQWQRANNAFAILEQSPDPSLPHGLPFGVCFGNHEQLPRDQPGATTEANRHFGVARFRGRDYYGGSFGSNNDENWVQFWAGGMRVIVVNMQFNPSPSEAVLAWARRVFETHPDAFGIVNSHYIVTGGGNFSPQGAAIYRALRDVPNVHLMASGHVAQDARRTDEYQGNVIHSMLSDYQRSAPDPNDPNRPVVVEQSQTNGGAGYMRIWRFSPAKKQLFVESYSPMRRASYTNANNQFTLPIAIKGSGGAFEEISRVVVPSGGTAEVELPGVDAGKSFEWYAVARDCSHKAETALESLAP